MATAKALFESIRPAQWVKNLLVFAALVFGHMAGDMTAIARATLTFLVFCAAASGVYLLNDIRDCEADRRHPLKRERPIASGQLSLLLAATLSALLMIGAAALSALLGGGVAASLVAFLLLQLLYSFGLKRVVIVDVIAVALGFVLRAVAGAYAIDVEISPWLLVCSFTLALFLALAKRRHEVVLLEDRAHEHRASLSHYSPYFLDQLIGVVTATTVVAYALYTLAPDTVEKFETHNLVFTLPFVIYGIFRYLYLVHQKQGGENPTRVFLTDPVILINTTLWAIVSAWIVYA
jgi:4-hydroxybenzoate polyprenyltransferase